MKILKTKWYIALQIAAMSKRFELVGDKSFGTMTEAESYKQRRTGLYPAGRVIMTVQGRTILAHPERYGVVDGVSATSGRVE